MTCLRPTFTQTLAERLLHGSVIHLVSPHGQGRRRTLADLRRCLPVSMRTIQANVRDYPLSLPTMLADLASQAGLAGVDSLRSLLDSIQQASEHTLIILHNFDELQPGTASGYDDGFFEALNGIRDRHGIALLCVSERAPEAWPLHIDAITLPPLTAEQIQAELARRNPSAPAGSWPEVANWLAGQPAPYSLLEQPATWPVRYR